MIAEDLLHALQKHVSDRMPIRCLKLPEMQLVEQATIIAYLTEKLAYLNNEKLLEAIRLKMERDAKAAGKTLSTNYTYTDAFNPTKERVIQYIVKNAAAYAILSHTWLPGESEVIFGDAKKFNGSLIVPLNMEKLGFLKLKEFCRIAHEDFKLDYAWMDTICIDKANQPELEESIRSMFAWYQMSSICIIYLASTTSFDDIKSDRWFTRGWTLQELLAPRRVAFYSQAWEKLGHHHKDFVSARDLESSRIGKVIVSVTGISSDQLHGFSPGIGQSGVATKMTWIANRQTTRGEDRAYSIMGIFGVKIPVIYGEGAEAAFCRLMSAIASHPTHLNTLAIFNYAGRSVSDTVHNCSILPSGPECYLRHHVLLNNFTEYIPQERLQLHPKGLQVKLLLVLAVLDRSDPDESSEDPSFTLSLDCFQNDSAMAWDRDSQVIVRLLHNAAADRRKFTSSNCFVFGVWSFLDLENEVVLPDTCSAFLFHLTLTGDSISVWDMTKDQISSRAKVDTQEVILLNRRKSPPKYLRIPKQQLEYYNLGYIECQV